MGQTETSPPAASGGEKPSPWKKLGIWAGFLAVVYVGRDFFFVAFMTFLFSCLTLSVVGSAMRRLSPHRDRPRLRRVLTLGFFLVVPLVLGGVAMLIAPRLLEQGRHLAGWVSRVSPETEVTRLLEGFVGPYQFKEHYHDPEDPRYEAALAEFRKTGVEHVRAYNDFPTLEDWVEAGFTRQFAEQEGLRIRARLLREGTSSKDFERWFLEQRHPPSKSQPQETAQEFLTAVRHDPAALGKAKEEWIQDTVARELTALKASPEYTRKFREYFEKSRATGRKAIPYTFDQYMELKAARPRGPQAFGRVMEKLFPTAADEAEDKVRQDFEAAKKHELFQEWWGTSSVAQFIRRQLDSGFGGDASERLHRALYSFLNVPVDLATALILSFFVGSPGTELEFAL